MNIVDAIALGAVQALTEFLPVSSSGHLRLGHALLGAGTEPDLFFDILLHVGTLLAVVAVYRAQIVDIVTDAFRGLRALRHGVSAAMERSTGLRFVLLVVIATLPTGVMGILLEDIVESDLFSVPVVGGLLLLNGAILWLSKPSGDIEDPPDRRWAIAGIGPAQALIIGIAQGIAILPGISRSGITIVTALLLGADRLKAAEFSFLLSIPAILGATVLKFDPSALTAGGTETTAYILGALTSAIIGVGALVFLLRLLRNARFHHFSWYCWGLGAASIVLYVVQSSS